MQAALKPKLQETQRYTYADYCTWGDDERWELIDGIPYAMSPSPTRTHQKIVGNIYSRLEHFLRGKSCEVYISPFDVRLNPGTKDDTVVQPDIVVVCDKSKLNDSGCVGAPDMVVEVLSPSTARRDRWLKFTRYIKAGVREYWIVDPETKTASVHILIDGAYTANAYSDEDTVPVFVLDGCKINMGEVFGE